MILNTLILLSIGFISLYFGAKLCIIGLEDLAHNFGISHLLVGLTILSIGTSLPEIAVSIIGGLDKLTGIDSTIDGIIIGNKVGSFMVNITLIIGILATTTPVLISKWELRRDIPMLFISFLIFVILSIDGYISQIDAILMILFYVIYLLFIIWSERRIATAKPEVRFSKKQELTPEDFSIIDTRLKKSSNKKAIVFFISGLLILLLSAEITILNAHDLARELSIPENVIGIFIVGIGTSLPELIADLTALRRHSYGLAVGDILGSNVCDILLAAGSGAVIVDFRVAPVIMFFDLPILFLAIIFTSYFLWTEKRLQRWEGGFLIGFFVVYTIIKLFFFQKIT